MKSVPSGDPDELLDLLRGAIARLSRDLEDPNMRVLMRRSRDLGADFGQGVPLPIPTFAAQAVQALGFNDRGEADRLEQAVMAVNAVLRSVLRPYPVAKVSSYAQLKTILESEPLDRAAVLAWYRDFCQ